MRQVSFLTVFFLLILNLAYGQNEKSNNMLLWEISGNGAKSKSYLFGSFHTNDKRVFKIGDSTYYALNNAEGIVLETDVFELFEDLDTRTESLNLLYDANGNPYTASKKASKTLYGDEDGMPQFLDAYFQQFCYNTGKDFYPLESVEDQMNLFSSNQDLPIPNSLPDLESRLISQERILETYITGDIHELDKIMKTTLSLYDGLYDELIIQRNFVMANGIDSLVKKQQQFIAVGAGHLAGNYGIISLLSKKGYKVRKVEYVNAENSLNKSKFLSSNSYQLELPSIGLFASLPGKPIKVNSFDGATHYVYREMGQGNSYSIEIIPNSDSMSLESLAEDYIRTPRSAKITFDQLDDGTNYAEGLSNTYPDGLTWVRIIESPDVKVVIRAFGGNKFMHSNRPRSFFNKVGFKY